MSLRFNCQLWRQLISNKKSNLIICESVANLLTLMFNLFKKIKKDLGPGESFPVTTDMHSHILPGIDDGSPDIATSLKLVKGLYDLGYRRLVATPHIICLLYTSDAADDLTRVDLGGGCIL